MRVGNPTVKRLKVTNFKSFSELELELNQFNVIVGPNASGKSNFVQIFNFLRDIGEYGIDHAISLQGGIDDLRNITLGESKELSVEIVLGKSDHSIMIRRSPRERHHVSEVNYKFKIGFENKTYTILEDRLKLSVEPWKQDDSGSYKGEIVVEFSNGEIQINANPPNEVSKRFLPYLAGEKFGTRELLLYYHFPILRDYFEPITQLTTTYDFDPKLPKRAVPAAGINELESNGENVSLALKEIIQDPEGKRKLLNILGDCLPFLKDLDVEMLSDRSFLFTTKESYFKDKNISSPLLSDGTISIICLVLALYFERNKLIIVEEPERDVHPAIIPKLVEMMKEVSEYRQIIITTHNPEMIRNVDTDSIVTVSRDDEGFSIIKRLDKKKLEQFLSNNIMVQDLYVANVLPI